MRGYFIFLPGSDQAVELLPEFFDLFVCQSIDDIKEFCIEGFGRLYKDHIIANWSGGNIILFVNPFGLCMFQIGIVNREDLF